MDEQVINEVPVEELPEEQTAKQTETTVPPQPHTPLQFRVGSTAGKVLIQYSDVVSYVELLPQVAEEFAKVLKHHAKKARRCNY